MSSVVNTAMLQQLVQMGFDATKAEQALIATQGRSIDLAIEYLYGNTANVATQMVDVEDQEETMTSQSGSSTTITANTLKYSVNQLKTDKLRGESAEVKMQFEEKRKREEAEKIRQEKLADKRRLKELKKQMQAEKEARQREQAERMKRFETNLTTNTVVQTNKYDAEVKHGDNNVTTQQRASTSSPSSTGSVRDCTVQIRLPDGKVLMCNITSDKSLQDIHDFVTANVDEFANGEEAFSLITAFPRREYNPQEMQLSMVPLSDAGLVPRGSLIVQKSKSKGVVTRGTPDPNAATNNNNDNNDNFDDDQ